MKLSQQAVDGAIGMLLRILDTQSLGGDPLQLYTRMTGERANLEAAKIERQIENLEFALCSLQNNLYKRISAARQARNAFASIHRLSAELLLSIFALTLQEAPKRDYYKVLGKITLVSKAFHTLIDKSPNMWSFLSPDLSKKLLQAALVKSKKVPLTIDCGRNTPRVTSEKFLKSISNQIHRVHSLSLLVDNTDQVRAILRSSAPILTDLTLRPCTRTNEDLKAINIFGGTANRLQNLTSHGVPLTMEGNMFLGLRSLELTFITSHAPKISRLLEIIAGSPLLEALVLQQVQFTSPLENIQHNEEIHLMHLETLTLEVSGGVIATLLARLRAPHCAYLQLGYADRRLLIVEETASERYFEGSLDQFSSLLRSANKSTTPDQPIQISLGHEFFACAVCEVGDVKIDLTATNPFKLLKWVATAIDAMGTAQRCTLVLLPELALADKALYAWLDKFPCVTSIRITTNENAQPLLRYLGCRTGQTLRWPLPKLQELSIGWNTVRPYEVLDMVQKRYGRTATSSGPKKKGKGKGRTAAPNLPSPFTMLDLSGIRELSGDIYKQLVDIVGMGQVIRERTDFTYRVRADPRDDSDYAGYSDFYPGQYGYVEDMVDDDYYFY